MGTLGGLLAYGRWLFAGIFMAAVVYATLPRLFEIATRVQNYPKLLNQIVTLRERLEAMEGANDDLQRAAADQYTFGVKEGFARARGAVLARLGGAPPDLKAITERDGDLVLVGEFPPDAEQPAVGARYRVEDVYTTEQKGVVEITVIEEERRLVFMTCVDSTVPGFWSQLAERAPTETAPPAGVVLLPVEYGAATSTEAAAAESPKAPAASLSPPELRIVERAANGD